MADSCSTLETKQSTRHCLSLTLGARQASITHDGGDSSSTLLRTERRNLKTEVSSSSSAKLVTDASVPCSEHAASVKKTCPKTTMSVQDDGHFSPNLTDSLPVVSLPANSESRKLTNTSEDEETTLRIPSQVVLVEDFKTPAARTHDSMGLSAQISGQKNLKVRAASGVLPTPAAKKFTRIVPQDEVDGTPLRSGPWSLGLMYREAMSEEDSGYSSYSSPEMFPCRPCKAGRETMDIVSELGHHEPSLLDRIFVALTDEDIVRFSGVCRDWRHLVEGRKEIAWRKRHFLQKSKPRVHVKENYPQHTSQRATVTSSIPLGEVQRLGQPQAASTPAPRLSIQDRFQQASESLFADESLTKCAKHACQSPAKLLMNGQRGQCLLCGYDFCTNCRCEFHVSSVCPALRKKNTAKQGNSIGSGKSKRSLRRLARLASCP